MSDASPNPPVRPSLASRGVRKLRRKLGLTQPVKMTPEASKFLAEYREWLGRGVTMADEYLAAHEERGVVDTLEDSKGLMGELAELQAKSGRANLDLYLPIHTMVYLICRKVRPQKVVETGVEKGGTSHMILQALDRNGRGRLWSIDIGSTFWYKERAVSSIGPLVEDRTKARWNLVKGDAQKILGDVLRETGDIDVFCAGQGHTYEVQKHEGGGGVAAPAKRRRLRAGSGGLERQQVPWRVYGEALERGRLARDLQGGKCRGPVRVYRHREKVTAMTVTGRALQGGGGAVQPDRRRLATHISHSPAAARRPGGAVRRGHAHARHPTRAGVRQAVHTVCRCVATLGNSGGN